MVIDTGEDQAKLEVSEMVNYSDVVRLSAVSKAYVSDVYIHKSYLPKLIAALQAFLPKEGE